MKPISRKSSFVGLLMGLVVSTSSLADISGMHLKTKAMLDGTIEGGTSAIATNTIGKFSEGSPEKLKQNADAARAYINEECSRFASEVQSGYPEHPDVHDYALNHCASYSMSTLEQYL